MLKNLEVLNGDMTLDFDSLNTIYTITLNTDDDYVDLVYQIEDTDNISIFGNELKEGINEVVLTVYNDDEQTSYYLYVLKNKESLVNQNQNTGVSLEVNKTPSINNYAVPIIAGSCFLLILLFFTFLFKKN